MVGHKNIINIGFTVVKGHQIASGLAADSPYPKGSIEMQAPYFKMLGLDLSNYYLATINAQFNCHAIATKQYHNYFQDVHWAAGFASESFGFIKCGILWQNKRYDALIYQPDKTTKIAHTQPENCLEIIAPKLDGLDYGDQLILQVDANYIELQR
ncbi:hypothetical protein J7384_09510 [Endozoicomonas sp. G2_1]|uniref:hypothetical protein n=1 Tax=Endozoicomonas sp. G2_1 TaxID=2821091 RepID=UPI001ADCEE6C|nr:hypothetical protein [Endozoicomonas sp. G2_1]MBO9490600.1 hypothetical protein [Endozoicomonas sp. G2_1]